MSKIFKTIALIAVIGFGVLGFSHINKENSKPVASLDGREIDKKVLVVYLEEVLGDEYSQLLKSDDGLKTLADYYINRTLLLGYAKETIGKDNPILTKHKARGSDQDTMYLTALLKVEVQDKVVLTEKKIEQMMQVKPELSRAAVEAKLKGAMRAEYTNDLIEFVRKGHEIEYLI